MIINTEKAKILNSLFKKKSKANKLEHIEITCTEVIPLIPSIKLKPFINQMIPKIKKILQKNSILLFIKVCL